MEPKDYLKQMIDNTIDGDTEAAAQSFKDYLVPKTIEVLGINTNSPARPSADAADDPEADPVVAAGDVDPKTGGTGDDDPAPAPAEEK